LTNLKMPFAYDQRDTDDIRLENFTISLVAVSCSMAGVAWTVMYYVVLGSGWLPYCLFLSLLPAERWIFAI